MAAVCEIRPHENTGSPSPFWSVMIPTYRPEENYLKQALDSVLIQDQGSERMQIEVVDDCSPDVDVETMVKSLAGERVKFSRTLKNLGLAGCWNTCVERAYGKWIHLLHQDDFVLYGFYCKLALAESMGGASVGAAFCRHSYTCEDSVCLEFSAIHKRSAGILENWKPQIAEQVHIQTPSIVVRRSVYERIGGYRSDLSYMLDWEMWQRISMNWSFWFEPNVLAAYRIHEASETARLMADCKIIKDFNRLLSVSSIYQEPQTSRKYIKTASKWMFYKSIMRSRRILAARNLDAAFSYFRETCAISQSPIAFLEKLSFYFLYFRIRLSILKKFLIKQVSKKAPYV